MANSEVGFIAAACDASEWAATLNSTMSWDLATYVFSPSLTASCTLVKNR